MKAKNKPYITIGKLVKKFKKYYPDLSTSKIRFLEKKGLFNIRRSSNGYRVFYRNDVNRINFILKMQKNYYMPLKIIKKKLKKIDFNKVYDESTVAKDLQLKLIKDDNYFNKEKGYTSTKDIKKKYNISQEYINDLLENDIVDFKEEDGKYIINNTDIEILEIIGKLAKFGIKIKNLKLFENFSSRQSLFIKQIVMPLLKSSNKNSYKKASKILHELELYLRDLQAMLVKKENKKFMEQNK